MKKISDLEVGDVVIVNNLVFKKQKNGKWKSAFDEMWESAFISYCSKANSVVFPEEKPSKVDLNIHGSEKNRK